MRKTLFIAFLITINLNAATYYVDASRPDDTGDGITWHNAKKTIQSAVDLTATNDLVLVTNGVYSLGNRQTPNATLINVLVITNSITVQSINGPEVTIIEGPGPSAFGNSWARRCVYMSQGRLSGFTLNNGATYDHNYSNLAHPTANYTGGGVCKLYGSSLLLPIVTNCIIQNCVANSGGGAAGVSLINCVIRNNRACVTDPTIGNAISRGGGAYYCTMQNCLIINNKAHANAIYPEVFGGGVNACILSKCSVISNTADTVMGSNTTSTRAHGGGAYESTLSNCLVLANNAASTGEAYGGGTYKGNDVNCSITANTSIAPSGTYARGGGTLEGYHYNSVVWANYSSANGIIFTNNFEYGYFNYCCTSPKPTLDNNNINADPLFVGFLAGDYRLRIGSPCLDVGANAYMKDILDLAGNLRTQNTRVDLGAYEGAFKIPQSITFPAPPITTYGDAAFAPIATASSGLSVAYASENRRFRV